MLRKKDFSVAKTEKSSLMNHILTFPELLRRNMPSTAPGSQFFAPMKLSRKKMPAASYSRQDHNRQ